MAKPAKSIAFIMLGIFLLIQVVGIFVFQNYFSDGENLLPLVFQDAGDIESSFLQTLVGTIIPSFVLAVFLIFVLTKYNMKNIIRGWFFIVIWIAIFLSVNSFWLGNDKWWIYSLIIGFCFALLKLVRPSIVIHNFTEVLIYPGIATIFIPLLNVISISVLLVLISIYDIWAVWHSGIMQKMAKFQMEEVKIFGGLMIPHLDRKTKAMLKRIKTSKGKNKKMIRVRTAILGGGDIVFPIITAGVFYRAFGVLSSVFVVLGAFAGLCYLYFLARERKEGYPAMPYIVGGIALGVLAWFLIF